VSASQLEWASAFLPELEPFQDKTNPQTAAASGALFALLKELNHEREAFPGHWSRADIACRAVVCDGDAYYLFWSCGERKRVMVLHLAHEYLATSAATPEPTDAMWSQAKTRLDYEGW
jgi:hypothetical protein